MGCRIYCWDSYSILTLLDWHLEQCRKKDATCTIQRYYETDFPAHVPHQPGRNNTGQVILQMRGSLSWDEDWNVLSTKLGQRNGFSALNWEIHL